MEHVTYIVSAVVLIAAVLATGWWRLALAGLRIRSGRMTVDRLGLAVPAEHVPRVNAILASFAGGFNTMLLMPSASAWERYCASLPTLCRPFAHEGVAMGFTVRRLFRYKPRDFEERLVHRYPGFRYLYYVGLGFWSGMREHDPQRLARIAAGLDALHGHLCYDGYGFKHAFFDYPKDRKSLARLDSLSGYARNAAYQGAGRALFFHFMARPDTLIGHLDDLGDHAYDAAGGVGLASAFVFPDRLEVAQALASGLPARWHEPVHLGMCFGLKARSINDPDQFERDIARLDPSVQDAVRASIGACDRIEAQVRAQGGNDGYRRWRTLVTEWMAGHIQYPLAGVKTPNAEGAENDRL